jgi:glucan phosphoethanolaminetransferase (alkaline phosphatase superfamily)
MQPQIMKLAFKKIIFAIFVVVMLVYFFARPWTPFWIDLSVIMFAIITALFSFLVETKDEASVDTCDNDRSDKGMKRIGAVIVLVLVIAVIILAAFWIKRELAVDSCLDNGGRWNSKVADCEMTPN